MTGVAWALLGTIGLLSLLGLPDASVTLDLNDQVIFKEARLQGRTGRYYYFHPDELEPVEIHQHPRVPRRFWSALAVILTVRAL